MSRINVTQTFLPDFDEYAKILKRAWDKKWITNNGELAQELETKLKEYLGVKHLLFTGNGTIVLQMAIKAMGITGEIITTPFSYVATTNAILWEGCTPVFVDIHPENYTIDVSKIEEAITEKTQAILATHVYGVPCDIEAIQKIADKYQLKVIYDGAHAFGSKYKGNQILSYGDVSTCSFHATKLFHTVEGGCIITDNDELAAKLRLYRSFGHIGDDYFDMGINGKNSEFHAAMGLAVLPHLPMLIESRRKASQSYDTLLGNARIKRLKIEDESNFNYAYYPVVFDTHEDMGAVKTALEKENIFPRRYFYPSLNNLPFLNEKVAMPISDDISSRVLALPLYAEIENEVIEKICSIIRANIV
ncbi:MAG: DegT/DnrJ/EryC1/StrS family aminotransferase [Flavobacteriales bacterium]